MTKLYIIDLDGTTGTYRLRNDVNGKFVLERMFLRPGLEETVNFLNEKSINYAIATIAGREYAELVVKCWREIGIDWKGKVYTRDDVRFSDKVLFPYKNLDKIYEEHGVTNPEEEAVVIGDLFGLDKIYTSFSIEKYLGFNFNLFPEVLSENNRLIDHPYPKGLDFNQIFLNTAPFNLPVYVVLPQAFTYNKERQLVTIDMFSVITFLERMYSAGNNHFSRGFNRMKPFEELYVPTSNVFVESDKLANAIWGERNGSRRAQKYLVVKVFKHQLRPLIRIDDVENISRRANVEISKIASDTACSLEGADNDA